MRPPRANRLPQIYIRLFLQLVTRILQVYRHIIRNNSFLWPIGSQPSDSDVGDSMRRVNISPTPDYEEEGDSIDEIQESLSNIDDQFDDTENALTEWSDTRPSSYTSSRPYTGSPSFSNLPHYSSDGSQTHSYVSGSVLSPPPTGYDPRARLSRITERTEEPSTRPSSAAYSTNVLRRSALLGGHSRAATDPSGDNTLPPPGRATQLISIFESQTSASSPGSHSRSASTPGFRAESPRYGPRSASPTKTMSTSSTTSYGSYIGSTLESRPNTSSLLSPPSRPFTSTGTRTLSGTHSRTYSDSNVESTAAPYTETGTPYTYGSQTITDNRTYDDSRTFDSRTYDSRTTTNTYTEATSTPTATSWTPTATSRTPTGPTTTNTTLRRPQASPRSPLTNVRNIVAMWKERSPVAGGPGSPEKSPTKLKPGKVENLTKSKAEESDEPDDGLGGIRRRMQRARERDGLRGVSPSGSGNFRDSRSSMRSRKSGVLPPGFDLSQFSAYTQSDDPVCD